MNIKERLIGLLQDGDNPAWCWFPDNAAMIELVDYLLANDVTIMRHGQWVIGTGENGLQKGYRKCSQCGEIVKYGYSLYGVHNFCNYCGARMDGDDVNG